MGQKKQIGIESLNCREGQNCGEHGTHVTGIAAGNSSNIRGVAIESKLALMNVLSYKRSNNELIAYFSDMARGLQKVSEIKEEYNISVVSMSLSTETTYNTPCDDNYPLLTEKIEFLKNNRGVTTIIAAGNERNSTGIGFPSCISDAIAVSSVNSQNQISWFSNRNYLTDFFAPGENILSSEDDNTFGRKYGTSMSTPFVSGAFAVLKSAYPNKTNEEVTHALKITGANIFITDSRTGNQISRAMINISSAIKILENKENMFSIHSPKQNVKAPKILINVSIHTRMKNMKINITNSSGNSIFNKTYKGKSQINTITKNLTNGNYTANFTLFDDETNATLLIKKFNNSHKYNSSKHYNKSNYRSRCQSNFSCG